MRYSLLKKLKFLVIFILFSFLVLPTGVLAAKKKTSSKKTKTVNKSTKNVSIGVSARRKGQNVVVTFTKLSNARTIFYTFSYQAGGIEQGAGGTIKVGGSKSITRVVYLGTCSSGVCRPHTGLTNGVLEVTVTYKNGKIQRGTYFVRL